VYLLLANKISNLIWSDQHSHSRDRSKIYFSGIFSTYVQFQDFSGRKIQTWISGIFRTRENTVWCPIWLTWIVLCPIQHQPTPVSRLICRVEPLQCTSWSRPRPRPDDSRGHESLCLLLRASTEPARVMHPSQIIPWSSSSSSRDVQNRFFISVRSLKKLGFGSEWVWFGSVQIL